MPDDENDYLKPNPDTAWLESITIGGFKVWHIIAICLGILMSIVIMVCCCIRFRIPRTKQEIEADYQRKQITKKFREKLQQIKNSDMDDMDLQKDAHWEGHNCNYRSTYYDNPIFLPGVHMAWKSRNHSVMAYNASKAEGYMALCHTTKEVVLHRYFLKEMGFDGHIVHPTPPSYDIRQGQQFMVRNPPVGIHNNNNTTKTSNSNHQDIRYHYIRDKYVGQDDDVDFCANAHARVISAEKSHLMYDGCNL